MQDLANYNIKPFSDDLSKPLYSEEDLKSITETEAKALQEATEIMEQKNLVHL